MKRFLIIDVLDEGLLVHEKGKTKAASSVDYILQDIYSEIEEKLSLTNLGNKSNFSISVEINYDIPKPNKD